MDTVDNRGKEAVAKDEADKSVYPCDISAELVPQLYMEFESEKDAYDFYNHYAIKAGFSVRRGRDHKNKMGEVQDKSYFCSCEGYSLKDKKDENAKGARLLTRNGCRAQMKISSRTTGKFRVVRFIAEHNHRLAPPSMCHLLRSQRYLTSKVEKSNDENVMPKMPSDLMVSHADVHDDSGFPHVGYTNCLCTKRAKQMKIGVAGGILEYLQHMRDNDPDFFCAIEVDVEDKVTNVFWADGKMIVDYSHFGDVTCFDTTYKRFNENCPLCLFTGVNNHKQTIIFGSAFIYDETVDSFKWLMDTFTKAMGGKRPKTIITERDDAITAVVASQWPETHHRLCLWHIYQDVVKQHSSLAGINSKFSKDLQSCLYECEDKDEFEGTWCAFLKKYDLTDNAWLSQLYGDREKWALAYGRDKFCADMTGNQRNDRMNYQLKKYLDPQFDIEEFLQQFNVLVEDIRDEELKKDFKASHAVPTLVFQSEILKHASVVYTPTLFLMFQSEMEKVWDSEMLISSEVGTLSEYKITPFGKTQAHTVRFNAENCTVSCSCQKFEFMGLLCAHALKIMAFKNVRRIPDQYIVKRWTNDAKDTRERIHHAFTDVADPKERVSNRHRDLRMNFNKLAARAAETEETYAFAWTELDRVMFLVEDKLKALSLRNHKVPGRSESGTERVDTDAAYENGTNHIYDVESALASKNIKRKKFDTCIGSKRKKGSILKAMTKGKGQKEAAEADELSPPPQPVAVQTDTINSTSLSQQVIQGNRHLPRLM
ncbi:unnamed protein product [Spirodela intermedia]|uniref:Protein FAR1-RELATED SEQUENCE n=2 Tax=Spirodela intermedia TaxID=51605 RepID=A0A7I8JTG5_SPIIN|nr:unnamed protein product [Spirodela intermedia]CAA6673065.1 unnamed protein product [Spirodela intermedia]CAA7410274.1 unnamed protein product [Spirodela intermedia]